MHPFYSVPRAKSTLFSAALAAISLCSGSHPGWAFDSSAPFQFPTRTYVAEQGFVWIGEQFIPRPYRLVDTKEGTEINGHLIPYSSRSGAAAFSIWGPRDESGSRPGRRVPDWRSNNEDSADDEDDSPGDDRRLPRSFGTSARPFSGMRPGFDPWVPSRAGWLASELDSGAVVVALPEQPLALFTRHSIQERLFSIMVSDEAVDPADCEEFFSGLPRGADRSVWLKWAQAAEVPAAIRSLIETQLAEAREREEETMSKVRAIRRMDMLAYPLTVFGMILAVLSFGHLLMCLPRPYDDAPPVPSRGMIRAHTYSLILMAALSGMDLVWTLLASQAGQMRELNPLASRFIEDPQMLIAFKALATGLGCGLLYRLRHHARAQFATWWLCLICTVLTFRWLTFNSMFIA